MYTYTCTYIHVGLAAVSLAIGRLRMEIGHRCPWHAPSIRCRVFSVCRGMYNSKDIDHCFDVYVWKISIRLGIDIIQVYLIYKSSNI